MSGLLGWTWDARIVAPDVEAPPTADQICEALTRTIEFVKANGVPAAPAHPKFVAGNPPLVVTIYAYENRYREQ